MSLTDIDWRWLLSVSAELCTVLAFVYTALIVYGECKQLEHSWTNIYSRITAVRNYILNHTPSDFTLLDQQEKNVNELSIANQKIQASIWFLFWVKRRYESLTTDIIEDVMDTNKTVGERMLIKVKCDAYTLNRQAKAMAEFTNIPKKTLLPF